MIVISGIKVYDEPTSCGTCPFLFIPGKDAPSIIQNLSSGRGTSHHCTMFDEWHHTWANPPRRCAKLFKKAFRYPEGTELVITKNTES